MGDMLSEDPVGVRIPLRIRLSVFICGCCPGPGHSCLSNPREAASLRGFVGWRSSIPFYRQKEVPCYLQTREILNFKARSYFLFKIQIDRDCC